MRPNVSDYRRVRTIVIVTIIVVVETAVVLLAAIKSA